MLLLRVCACVRKNVHDGLMVCKNVVWRVCVKLMCITDCTQSAAVLLLDHGRVKLMFSIKPVCSLMAESNRA